jgi:hypothetical protein
VRENPSKQTTNQPTDGRTDGRTDKPTEERKNKPTELTFIESTFEEFYFLLLGATFLTSNPLNVP